MAMTLHKSGSRNINRRRSTSSNFSEINVTPLVDVMLVLLIIFMVAAPMLTVGVPVDLPKTHAAQLNDQIEPLVVSIDANGQSFLQETHLEGDELIARLMAITGSNPEARIFVRGDKSNNYGRVMEVMGLIAASGFSKVSLIAEMPANAPQPLKTVLSNKVAAPAASPQALPVSKTMAAPKPPTQAMPAIKPQAPVSKQGSQPSGQPITLSQKQPMSSSTPPNPKTGPGTR